MESTSLSAVDQASFLEGLERNDSESLLVFLHQQIQPIFPNLCVKLILFIY